ncbi:oxidoreductase molybdopterin binding protein [Denitrovibrio acetiphilus DSM 12809]|uniref:Oxidoreductase molybdopterin binding protein n=1 Tax=Denitrovibrio acetiphilus (strain DSM 12809 / NBRC 114555 / N2460) TaxID=522772 RepID=D4H0T3_DENA2|nr:molybdopterin-dependent oxidoreductase [Denitrovibrio acetiphilus]ADD68596.1 oxidoreductase molybdopterin binding protein [Denitrovibrio acetiphilus DSM 12809]
MGFLRSVNCPVFNIENTKEVPERESYTLQIGGETPKAGKYQLDDFLACFKAVTLNSRLTSVSKWSVRADWQGVRWADFVEWANPGEYKYVYTESYGGYSTSIHAEDFNSPRILICTHVAGGEIEFEYGGPVRMIIPNLWGYKSCKWLKRIYFMNEYIQGTWESNGYKDRGTIQPCMVEDVNTGRHFKISGGEVFID